ncbi:MAG: hypothetical protein KDJ78_09750 [Rhodobacteraceae bacterium]|nr:hypothetical protein [Paracoccaceae bacterium]
MLDLQQHVVERLARGEELGGEPERDRVERIEQIDQHAVAGLLRGELGDIGDERAQIRRLPPGFGPAEPEIILPVAARADAHAGIDQHRDAAGQGAGVAQRGMGPGRSAGEDHPARPQPRRDTGGERVDGGGRVATLAGGEPGELQRRIDAERGVGEADHRGESAGLAGQEPPGEGRDPPARLVESAVEDEDDRRARRAPGRHVEDLRRQGQPAAGGLDQEGLARDGRLRSGEDIEEGGQVDPPPRARRRGGGPGVLRRAGLRAELQVEQ